MPFEKELLPIVKQSSVEETKEIRKNSESQRFPRLKDFIQKRGTKIFGKKTRQKSPSYAWAIFIKINFLLLNHHLESSNQGQGLGP